MHSCFRCPTKMFFLLTYIDFKKNFVGSVALTLSYNVSLSDFSYSIYKSYKETCTHTYNEQQIEFHINTAKKIF